MTDPELPMGQPLGAALPRGRAGPEPGSGVSTFSGALRPR